MSDDITSQVYNNSVKDQMKSILGSSFQQPINCGQTTAVAHALTTLGFPTTVDEILLTTRVNIESVVGDGMTLAETHDMALRFIKTAKLPIFCECYHFDEQSNISSDDFWEACLLDGDAGNDDICVINFDTSIAHDTEEGEGHFAVIVGPLENKNQLVISDVNAVKYDAVWKKNYKKIFNAMMSKDSCGRSRGMLRFGLTSSKSLQRPLPSISNANRLVDWVNPPKPYNSSELNEYIPTVWDTHIGATNMEGPSAIAMALDILDKNISWDLDEIMRTLKESYTKHLNEFTSPDSLFNFLVRLSNKDTVPCVPQEISLSANATGSQFRNILLDNNFGTPGNEFLICYDFSVAYDGISKKEKKEKKSFFSFKSKHKEEGNVLAHTDQCWSIIADLDKDADPDDLNGVLIASTHNVIAHGRLWRTSLNNLVKSIQENNGDFIIRLKYIENNEDLKEQQKLDKLMAVLDADNDGEITADELVNGFKSEGFELSLEEAKELIAEVDADDNKVLDHSEALSLFAKVMGYNPENQNSNNSSALSRMQSFMNKFGCEPNDMGFATVHLAIRTANVQKCVEFYNNIIGWPLYKTVDRSHAGTEEDSYGSSWASFGCFASFVVFHQEDIPTGWAGHGPWSRVLECPPGLRPNIDENSESNTTFSEDDVSNLLNTRFSNQSISSPDDMSIDFEDIPFDSHGVVLEPSFYKKQMDRIAELDTENKCKFIKVNGVEDLFGGDIIKEAIVFKDPDGWPCIFFVSKLTGDDYKQRFPATPIVFCQYITAPYPDDEEQIAYQKNHELKLKTCPTLGETGLYVKTGRRAERDKWLNEFFFNIDILKQHEHYYEDIMQWTRHRKLDNKNKKYIQYEYELEGHFLVTRSNVKAQGAMMGYGDTAFDMGGNKGFVPVPHYGVNTDYINFSKMRDSIKNTMETHGVPKDAITSLAQFGHAPTADLLGAYGSLFPTDPDTCMSLLCCDPSGNVAEMKWYLDFGEMFHHKGEVGINDMLIDNSMLEDHFPEKALKKLQKRKD